MSPTRRRTRIIAGGVALLVAIGLPLGWYQLSVQPGAALVRAAFESGPAVFAGGDITLDESGVTVSRDIAVQVDGAPDASVEVHAPAGAGAAPVVLWIHGGGFVANHAADLAGYANVLARAGYVVVLLEYARAPEARYPTPVIQADAALGWIEATIAGYGGDPTRVFLGGDSAGAQLASQLAAVETDAAFAAQLGIAPSIAAERIRGVVLFCGLYDMATVGASGFPALRTFLWAYTGEREWERWSRIGELSTTETASAAYPPAFIGVGDADPFAGQGAELAAALEARGVDVTTEFWEGRGLGHEYQFDFRLPEARETLARTLAFLEERS